MRNPAESQDDYDNEGPIYEPVKLTAYDRRRNELRELEAKRDAIQSKAELTPEDQTRLAVLAPLIDKAEARFEREGKRALDDTFRKRRGIDDWRAGTGRDEYNAKRRKVRQHENADLSEMTAAQKVQYERDRRSDANWFKRQRDKGMTEAVITAAYVERIRQREAERAAQVQGDAEKAAYDAEIAEIRARAIM